MFLVPMTTAALEVMDQYNGLILLQYVLYHIELHGEDVEMHKKAIKKAMGKSRSKWANQSK